MEIKNWIYEEFPEYTEKVEGAVRISATGNEMGVYYRPDIEYAKIDGVPLHLQVLEPFSRNEPEKFYPCLVFVQGSAWMKQDVYKSCPMYARLAAKGYVVAVCEYRHSGIAAFPAQIQDARNAIRFMKRNGQSWHADVKNIFIGGWSSGGHTAVFAGMLKENDPMNASIYPDTDASVKGILDYYGSVNLLEDDYYPSTINHHLPDSPEGRVMGGADMRKDVKLREKGTAECYITPDTDLPPVMIVHGTKDRTVSTVQSVSLYHKLKACGKDAELYLIEGADHGGAEFWTDEMCEIADCFMKTCMNKET